MLLLRWILNENAWGDDDVKGVHGEEIPKYQC